MFVRPVWIPKSSADPLALIRSNPWALLVTNGTDGPFATNLPLFPEASAGAGTEPLVLVGHLARGNHHLAELRRTTSPVLAIFEGPWSYVTASWYPDRQMPSTYYYTAVHCYGRVEFQQDDQLEHSLEELVDRMESPHPDPWKTGEIPHSEITRRLPAIAGFRLIVSRMEAKFKLGQDEPLVDALAVASALEARAEAHDVELARTIRTENAGRA